MLDLNSSDCKQFLCHMIRGKLLHSYVRDGDHEYPNTILNGCVCHNGTESAHLEVAIQNLAANPVT